MKHFLHPKNIGKIKDADGIGQVGNPVCGDILTLYIKVGKNKSGEYIKDIKFQTLGCAAAIAVSSIVTEMVKGKSLDFASKVTNKNIADKLGGLPPVKYHCSLLGADALHKAIKNYKKNMKGRRNKNGK